MGPKKDKEAIVIVLDVGSNMKQLHESNKTFLDFSKECIMQIVQRKLFSNSSDELALIVFGSDKTNNKLASEQGGYENIDVLIDHLTLASWDFLKFINAVEISSSATADWLDAIIVAVEFIQDETSIRSFSHRKLVIFSNFESPVSDDQLDLVVGAIKEQNINVIVIGPDVQKTEYTPGKIKSQSQTDGEILISNLVDKVNGVICPFEDALCELMYIQRKSVKPMPWNVPFVISKNIVFPISAYKKISELPPFKWISEAVDDKNAGVVRESTYMKFDEDKEIQVEVEKHDSINGYQFGTTIIPFGESEEKMGYKSGPKGLYLIGCTSKERVPIHLLVGSGSYVIVGKRGDSIANNALQTFVEALNENNAVGIARRVYNNNSSATIGALFPVIGEHKYLVYVELPFAEDERIFKFLSFSNINPSKEQLNVIDSLIDEMNLDETDDRPEMYELTRNYDPQEQYILRCITQKALYPDRSISDDLFSANVLKPHPDIIESCKSTLEKVKDLFPLQKVEPKKKRFKSMASSSSDFNAEKDKGSLQQSNNITINLINPVEEFTALAESGKPFSEVCNQMQFAIEKLLSISDDKNLLKSLRALRKKCAEMNPTPYNECITKCKEVIEGTNGVNVWNLIKDEKLGLISKHESNKSDVSEETAAKFLEWHEKEEDSVYGSLDSQNDQSMDLLDEL